MSYAVIQPQFKGETIFVLGCGPSLRGFDGRILRNNGRVIAINDSFVMAPWADILYACDEKWWRQNKTAVEQGFSGRKITLENDIPGVLRMRNTGETGLETDPSGLRTGSNSGYQAINLAYHLGAKRIVLLGFDMHISSGRMHWRERSDNVAPEAFERVLKNTMLPKFETLREPLANAGVAVVNATPGSALEVWPMIPIDQVLKTRTIGRLSVTENGSAAGLRFRLAAK